MLEEDNNNILFWRAAEERVKQKAEEVISTFSQNRATGITNTSVGPAASAARDMTELENIMNAKLDDKLDARFSAIDDKWGKVLMGPRVELKEERVAQEEALLKSLEKKIVDTFNNKVDERSDFIMEKTGWSHRSDKLCAGTTIWNK